MFDRLDMAKALLNGAQIDRLGRFMQHAPSAAEGGDLDNTPLVWAADNGCVEVVEMLIAHGMAVNHVSPTVGMTPAHFAADRNHANVINVIADAGGNLEIKDKKGLTPLNIAACHLSLEATVALLRHGASISTVDNDGYTPLHNAAAMAGDKDGAARMVELLLRWGANEAATSVRGQAADIVGYRIPEARQAAEDLERVLQLLSKAPATRQAWVRRGLFVMGRSRPECLKLVVHAGNDSGHCQKIGDTGWIDVAARVLEFEEEGIFRIIVGYL